MRSLLKSLVIICTLFNIATGQTVAEVNSFCNMVSDYYKMPREILPAIIRVESDYQQNSISSKGAFGLMQVTKGAYHDYRRILSKPCVTNFNQVKYNWKDNIRVGSWYLFVYLMRIEKLPMKEAITCYYWGVDNLGVKSTDRYYNDVKGAMK